MNLRPSLSALLAASIALSGCGRAAGPEIISPTAAAAGAGAAGGAASASPETRPPNSDFQPAFPGQTRAPGLRTSVPLELTTIARIRGGPWAVELLPDGRFLVTTRVGEMHIVDARGNVSAPVQGLPRVYTEGQGGLLDVALDPQFASNRRIYWSYSEPRQGGNGTSLASGVLVEEGRTLRVDDVKVIFRQQPSLDSKLHFGSRIVFDAEGRHLFLTLGERSIPAGRVQAQDLMSDLGKVVRLNPDGSIPDDNPFVGRGDARPEIWSYGHRNVQAAALDARGRLWTIEHGPRGGDELNRPEAGRNYGWPVIGYGIDYPGTRMHESSQREGMEQPVYYWDPVIAPSGMIFHSGTGLPEWRGDIFVGGLGSSKLVRLKLEEDRVVGEEWLLTGRGLRVRDVKEGPGGELYLLVENPQGALLRVRPATGAGSTTPATPQ